MALLNPIIQREKLDIIMITEINPETRSLTVHDYPIPDFVQYLANLANLAKEMSPFIFINHLRILLSNALILVQTLKVFLVLN